MPQWPTMVKDLVKNSDCKDKASFGKIHDTMKTILATVGAAVTAVTLGAAEAESENSELEEEEAQIFEAGFDADFFSAYVWRNAVQTDEPVLQPCVWADFTHFDPFWLGFSIWQNYDLTSRRHEVMKGGLTETDYNLHLGATAWANEDEDMSLDLEIGHEWFVNQQIKSEARESYKNTAELYVKATFNNPIANVYGQASWMYDDFGDYKQGMHYEIGFNKEIDLVEDTLSLGADWNVNFGDSRYLYFLYGGVDYVEDEFGDETWSNPDAGIGGTTIKTYLTWHITDWMSLVGTIAYTGVLNGSARQELANGPCWQGDCYRRDLLWGGISLKFEY